MSTTQTEALILDAITTITNHTGGQWAGMGAVRDESGLNRETFDATVTAMAIGRKLIAIPEENQKTITPADDYNAVVIGGEAKHLLGLA